MGLQWVRFHGFMGRFHGFMGFWVQPMGFGFGFKLKRIYDHHPYYQQLLHHLQHQYQQSQRGRHWANQTEIKTKITEINLHLTCGVAAVLLWWSTVGEEGSMKTPVGVAEMKVVIERTGGLVVLAESFGRSVFKDSFRRVFKKGEESLGLSHNGTLEINCREHNDWTGEHKDVLSKSRRHGEEYPKHPYFDSDCMFPVVFVYWGHDFRINYKNLRIEESISHVPVVALFLTDWVVMQRYYFGTNQKGKMDNHYGTEGIHIYSKNQNQKAQVHDKRYISLRNEKKEDVKNWEKIGLKRLRKCQKLDDGPKI
ncbi:hypothetical protein LXL04_011937 [Taraxacum kok-saghyz]